MIQFHPYSIILSISALATLIVFLLAWHRTAPGALALKGMLLSMFIWGGSYALSWAFIPFSDKVFWLKVMFFGMTTAPGFFLLFALRITHHDEWITFRNYVLLFSEPFITILLIWFAPGAIFKSITLVDNGGLKVLQFERGTIFWVSTVYSYALIFASYYLFIISYPHANSFFKRQYRWILAGSILPFGLSFTSQIMSPRFSDLDMSAISFGATAIIYAYTILHHQLMDLIPVARSHLIEKMSDGVLVLDAQGRIVDINPSLVRFLEDETMSILGKDISELFTAWNEDPSRLLNGSETRTELRLPNKSSRYLDLRVTPLYDENQSLSGHLIIFRDVTERKEVEKDLRFAMDRLQSQLIENRLLQDQLREQAIRDPLTNLFNRRYLEETLDRELARAMREVYPLCIVMMDIDHFKKVNDTYGHEAGDLILKTLADTVTSQSRQGDFVCRFGGEEFVLVMPNITIDVAKDRVKSLHRYISSLHITFGRYSLKITLSMGISWYPRHGENKKTLLRAADRALYVAKNAGRNRVAVYREVEKEKEKV